MAGVTKVGQNFASSVGRDTNSAATNTNSRYAVLKSSDLPTSLSERIEMTKSENEERSKKRGYEDLTGRANDSDSSDTDTPTQKRPKLDSDSPSPIDATPIDTDIFDLLPKGFPGLSIELIDKIEEIQSDLKSVQKELMWVVQKLCSITPLSAGQLSVIINREEGTLSTYTKTMVKKGQLSVHNSDLPVSHKHQKFVACVPEQNDSALDDTDTSTQQCTKITSPTATIPVETDILDFLPERCPALSEELKQKILKIRSCDRKILPEEIQKVIKKLCSIIPFSTAELTIALNRKEGTLLKYIGPMIGARLLFCTDPSKPKSWKEQKFVAPNLY